MIVCEIKIGRDRTANITPRYGRVHPRCRGLNGVSRHHDRPFPSIIFQIRVARIQVGHARIRCIQDGHARIRCIQDGHARICCMQDGHARIRRIQVGHARIRYA